jgi:homocysteine S-methyltransferase
MSHRAALPQLDGGLFLTDGGLETTLIFLRGHDLPAFAAFHLLKDEEGTEELRRYFDPYLEVAAERGAGFILESPTWRASPQWAGEIGYSPEQLDQMNRKAIGLMEQIRDASDVSPIVISGCVGPQGDGYDPDVLLSAGEAQAYHSTQIGTFADTAADMVTAITMTYAEEAIGVARAAEAAGLPVAISFTVETDGRLPSGQPLGEAIEQTDAETGGRAAYFMINCAHPSHFEQVLTEAGGWRDRIHGLRSNASAKSHAELDEATELDDGDPADLARRHAELRDRLPGVNVLGGCCGTDHRHVAEISSAWR